MSGMSASRAAAEWWGQRITSPTFQMIRPEERATDPMSAMTEWMMGMRASNHPVASDAVGRFVDLLEKRIETEAEQQARWRDSDPWWVSLSVDYGPCSELAECAQEAGVSSSRFPIKTHMAVTADYVTAALGYGARDTLVWSAPGWVRPSCGAQRYDSDYVNPLDEVCGLLRFHGTECGDWSPDPERCASCGGTYSEHYSRAAWDRDGRCNDWRRQMVA